MGYPFLKEYPWNDAGYTVTLPGASPSAVLKAIQPTLEMGAAMDPSALKAGVLAHAKSIGSVDGNGVTSLADYTAINKALGHMIASAGEAKTMAVYNAWKGLVPAEVPAFLMSKVNAGRESGIRGADGVQGCGEGLPVNARKRQGRVVVEARRNSRAACALRPRLCTYF